MTSLGPSPDQGQPDMLRPARFCADLLGALEASEGRRRRRRRDTTPDAIGHSIKRELLEATVHDDPDPADFEAWLANRCLEAGLADGPTRAMALSIWDEWRLAASTAEFRHWLAIGAPLSKSMKVGMPSTPYCTASSCSSSTSTLTNLMSSRSPAISSRIGDITRHGGHHVAQKSTRTGVSASRTSAVKVSVVTGFKAMAQPWPRTPLHPSRIRYQRP